MTHTATRIIGFDAAHRVLRHESKCGTLHGHRYKAEITCQARDSRIGVCHGIDSQTDDLDSVGRVIDFGVIKEIIGTWIDENLDHTTIVGNSDINLLDFCTDEAECDGKRAPYVMYGEPTAENIAALLFETGNNLLESHGSTVRVVHVKLWETPNCYAEYEEIFDD